MIGEIGSGDILRPTTSSTTAPTPTDTTTPNSAGHVIPTIENLAI